ncbi:MAG TPA: NADH-ubiquinone oxidoreductase-F iron-sulfur binding region domain-containing protein [Gaiellaceae bacterium]|nr:NADH-ubiquinone oxidoreductase-F iron-sulfur binding region domain-containing protein [Gaiellaceae bacterium]
MSALADDALPAARLPRLLAGLRLDRAVSLDEHLARLGPLPRVDLVAAVEASGLRGRGGGGFPTGAKLRAVAARRSRPVVVANATEAEPVCAKDEVLLRHVPHLVLDGAVAAAAALGAREAIVVVGADAADAHAEVARAIEARAQRRLEPEVSLRLAVAPPSFVAGEETALVSFLSGRAAKPTFKPPLPFERGVGGGPTLVQNAETLAHVALISRFGPDWFRAIGTADDPGSALLTVSGAIRRPGVYEIALGTRLVDLLAEAGGVTATPQAFLLGGYFGTWVDAARAQRLELSAEALRPVGASLGAGAVVVLPASACGLTETARIARWLAHESAGQCGPCVHGLAAVAGALDRLAACDGKDMRPQLARWLRQIEGRGACRHPDGSVRLVASALDVFEREVRQHLRGSCTGNVR